ncbi:Casein kinase I [Tritrichomonas foetus]|uniref:non-specific serine/threonine protein kinase n=1 Tax=Tritrichomonas foetus TaxID=1144522 RepID=A0A1J4KHY9_9EUKA|nr:Casein kinase I [Tritrichomonas foetus]|eukprot:OHT08949.1 Casein kinase I [Tritrichomonas foetus]
MSLLGATIGHKYRISELIGQGSFGETYRGINVDTLDEIAIKAEPTKSKSPQLSNEYELYKSLAGCFGVANVEYFGSNRTHRFLVMDLLGKSLEDLFGWCNHKFSLKTVLMLADQMILCIESVHQKNLIHRDIKPDNFMVGVNNKSNLLYLIDFGLMTHYYDPKSGKHIPYTNTTTMVGTARYASIGSLSGIEQARRDDLESLAYVWAYFLRSGLPWMSLEDIHMDMRTKHRKILEMKMHLKDEELFEGFPHEFVEYLNIVRNLKFDETPNYSQLRDLLRKAFIREGFVYDYNYDWSDTLPTFSVFKSTIEEDLIFTSPLSKKIPAHKNNNDDNDTISGNSSSIKHGKKLVKSVSCVTRTPRYPEPKKLRGRRPVPVRRRNVFE